MVISFEFLVYHFTNTDIPICNTAIWHQNSYGYTIIWIEFAWKEFAVKNRLCAYGSFEINRHSTMFIFALFLQIFAIFCFQFLYLVRNGEPLFRYLLQYLLIVYTWIWETYISKCYKLCVLVLVRPSVNLCSIYIWQK